MSRKVYVDVLAKYDKEGYIIPKYMKWENDKWYAIDKVTEKCRRAAMEVGGVGDRYTCVIQSHQRYLFLEGNRWFVEAER